MLARVYPVASGRSRRSTLEPVISSTALEIDDDEALLRQLAHRVRRALAGVTGVLDAAVGHLVGPEGRRFVDGDAAELERARGRERAS